MGFHSGPDPRPIVEGSSTDSKELGGRVTTLLERQAILPQLRGDGGISVSDCTLRSGGSGKRVTSRKQAIAIALSEARQSGAKVPKRPR